MKRKNKINRREFLAAAGAALSVPYLIPSNVLGARGRTGANEKLTMAHIGVGGMGEGNVNNVSSETEIVTLTETGATTGVFTGTLQAEEPRGGQQVGLAARLELLDRRRVRRAE